VLIWGVTGGGDFRQGFCRDNPLSFFRKEKKMGLFRRILLANETELCKALKDKNGRAKLWGDMVLAEGICFCFPLIVASISLRIAGLVCYGVGVFLILPVLELLVGLMISERKSRVRWAGLFQEFKLVGFLISLALGAGIAFSVWDAGDIFVVALLNVFCWSSAKRALLGYREAADKECSDGWLS
jgi:MFS family permease